MFWPNANDIGNGHKAERRKGKWGLGSGGWAVGSGSYAVYSSVFSFCFQFCAFSYQPSAATALILLIMAAAAAAAISAATEAAQQLQTFAIKRIRFNEFGSTAATRPQTDAPVQGPPPLPPYRWQCKNCRCLSLLFFFFLFGGQAQIGEKTSAFRCN